jgi:putative sterol carrier protein
MSKPDPKEFLTKTMPTLLIPERAKGWNRIVNITIDGVGDYIMEFEEGKVSIREGKHPSPNLEVWFDSFDTLYGMCTGEVFPPLAMTQNKMKATGPMSDQMKFGRVWKIMEKK